LRFETLIEQYHDEIYSYLWRLLRGATSTDRAVDADDLTQEVFLRAYQSFERLWPNSNYRAWLYKIATNCAYTALKRGQRQARENVPLLDEAHHAADEVARSPWRQAVLGETLDTLRQAIAALPPKQGTALIMRHVQGLEYVEIAQALACSQESARANVYQAVRRLCRELGETVAEALVE